MDGILSSVKKLLGLSDEITAFDQDLIIQINGAISALTQIGVGPSNGFLITGNSETYIDFLGDEESGLQLVKLYLFYKTKLGFDPPTNGSILESLKEMIKEIECRLSYQVDPKDTFKKAGENSK
jgi:hypothetical protein